MIHSAEETGPAPTQPAWGPRSTDKNKLPLDSVPIQNFWEATRSGG